MHTRYYYKDYYEIFYKYHYNTDYPIELFIKNNNKKKYQKKISNFFKKENHCDEIYHESGIKEYTPNKPMSGRKFEKLTKIYYESLKYECQEINDSVFLINKNINLYNAKLIYSYHELYIRFLSYNNKLSYESMNDNDLYNVFKIFIKENNIDYLTLYNDSLKTFFKKSKLCHDIINYNDKDKIIVLFCRMKLDIEKIYKLNEYCIYKLKQFLKEKCIFNKSLNIKESKIIIYNNIQEKYDAKMIKILCNDIPITYIGSKKKLINKILNLLTLNDKNVFVELFSGSLCMSYVIKNLFPKIKIIAYENNKLLINFYHVLKKNYGSFIERLEKIINEIKLLDDKKEYIKNIINIVNEKIKHHNDLEIACYYYILNKVSYGGLFQYTKDGSLRININEQNIQKFLKFGETQKRKLYKYSIFLGNIKLINADILEKSNEIIDKVDNNTILYLDPPYDTEKNGYRNYQKIFDRNNHKQLKMFLDKISKKGSNWIKSNNYTGFISELYYKYNQYIITLKENLTTSFKKELLITSF